LAYFAAKSVAAQLSQQWRRLEGGFCPPEPPHQAPNQAAQEQALRAYIR